MKNKFGCVVCGEKFDFKDALILHTDARHEKISTPKSIAIAKKSVLIYASLTVILIIILAVAEYIK
ncbi:MAG: hypothetical protein HY515_00035 [Candidatus Aenigmarchaeota archaeon]|nr:hypothetical protein [Candidatus Aenigmarchaeota archaeon]